MTRWSFVRVLLCSLSLAALPPAARAQGPIGTKGTFVLSAERLFGISSNKVTTYTNNGEFSTTRTDVGLLWGSTTNVYMIPRVGVDFLVIDSLSLGLALGFFASDTQDETITGVSTIDQDGPTSTRFLIAPRVGWLHGFGNRLGVWLRGGFTYYYANVSRDRFQRNMMTVVSSRSTGFSVNLEPALTVSIAEHFGFSAGLALDIPLTGSQTSEVETPTTTVSNSNDQSVRNLGLAFALIGWF